MTENYEAYAVWSVVASSIIFAFAIIVIFRKYLAPAVAGAQVARNEEIHLAEARRDAALAELEIAREEQRKLKDALIEMRSRTQSQAQHERERILDEARAESERLLRNADGELDRARAAAQVAVRQRLLHRSVRRARERAHHEISPDVDARIITDFTKALDPQHTNPLAFAGENNHGS